MNDLYEFSVEWPSTSAQSVIVTGDFDQWSRSLPLLRSSTNNHFMGTIKVPYGCPTRYKFIVDGEWKVRQGEPTELSPEGYLNNIYYVPLREPLERLVTPKPSTGENGTLVPQENPNAGAKDTGNDNLSASAGQTEATIAVHETTPPPPMDSIPVSATSEPTTSPSTDAIANPESNGAQSPNIALAPIIPIPIVPVNAKENCTIDPTKAVSNEDNIGTFVGVRLPPKDANTKVEEEKEKGKVNNAAELPVTSPPVAEAPKEPPTEGAVKEEQTSAAVPGEEKTLALAPEPTTAVKTEENIVPQTDKPEEPKIEEGPKKEEEPKREEEPKKAEEPQPEASSATPTPDAQSTPKPSSRFVEGANTNGHTKTTSDTSMAVKSTSSPMTSSTAPGTTLAESITSGSSAPGKKIIPETGNKPNPGGVNSGDTKEFGVKEGKSSTKSGKKKRTNSIFGSLKRLFHGEKHKKTNASS